MLTVTTLLFVSLSHARLRHATICLNRWRRIVGRAGVATTRQPSISEHLHPESAHPQGSTVYGYILAMFPRRLTVANVSVIHPGADTFVSAAAAASGATAKVRDDQ